MFNFSLTKNNNWLVIINDIFQVSLILYLLIILTEQFKVGFFSNYLNLNTILFITIISGIIVLSQQDQENSRKNNKVKWYTYLLIALLGVGTTALIFIKLIDLNWLAYVISVLSGLTIIFISYLILIEE